VKVRKTQEGGIELWFLFLFS